MDDDYEPYLSCIQCGHAVYQASELRRELVGVAPGEEPSAPKPL